jgi:hypothetical protein
MPIRLTPRITVVLASLVFGLALCVQMLSRSSAPNAVVEMHAGLAAENPGPRPDLSLTATRSVPALRDPRKPRVRKPKKRHVVLAAPEPAPIRVVPSPTPAATAAPRVVPTPAPSYVAPKPRPGPTPAPTPPEPSGSFDTSGGFDSTGTP